MKVKKWVCIDNRGYEKHLIVGKIYTEIESIVDHQCILIKDETGIPSEYHYPSRFVSIDEKTIEYHIERAEKDVKHQTKKHQSLMKSPISHVINEKNSEKDITTAEEKLAILLSIQRNIKINKIL